MTQVEIKLIVNQWVLIILINEQVSYAHADSSLMAVLDVARTLQVHIDNADDLPFNQYYKAG